MQDALSKQVLRQYLLGALDEPQNEMVEHAYLTDENPNEYLSVAEDELIEDYLDGNLNPRERKSFEQFFLLPPERWQDVAIIRSLRELGHLEENTIQHQPNWHVQFMDSRRLIAAAGAMMALLVIFAAASINLYLRNNRLHRELASLEQRQSGSTAPSIVGQQKPFSAPIPLRPSLTRDIAQAVPQIQGTLTTEVLSFALQISESNFSSYHVALRTAEGEEIWSQGRLRLSGSAAEPIISVWLPTSILQPGDYQFVLAGAKHKHKRSLIGTYNFRVAKP